MYSSSEESDSDSGTNFKRGKRKMKSESPVKKEMRPARRSPEKPSSRSRKYDEDRHKREARRREDDSRSQKTENGNKKERKSPKRERVRSKERPKDITIGTRPKSRDQHDSRKQRTRSKSPDRRKDEVIKKERSRSREKSSNHHRATSNTDRKEPKESKRDSRPDSRHNNEVKKPRELSKHSEIVRSEPPKAQQRSKSPVKHSKVDSQHHHHSSSRKESSSRDRHHSQSRHEEKISKPVELKKPSRNLSHDDGAYGPALPPPTVKKPDDKQTSRPSKRKSTTPVDYKPKSGPIGPSLPKDFCIPTEEAQVENYDVITSDEDDNIIGPLPASAEMTEWDLELEKRKIEIKLQQLDRRMMAMTGDPDIKQREEWMLELPEIRKVPDMGLSSRQFRKNDRPDFSDRSNWTKTPNDKHKKPHHDKKSDEDKRRDLETRRRDEQQEKIAKEHKKSHKRNKSLLEIHEKKLKKDKVSKDVK